MYKDLQRVTKRRRDTNSHSKGLKNWHQKGSSNPRFNSRIKKSTFLNQFCHFRLTTLSLPRETQKILHRPLPFSQLVRVKNTEFNRLYFCHSVAPIFENFNKKTNFSALNTSLMQEIYKLFSLDCHQTIF